jgi:subtilisin family serine protease
VGRLVPLAIVLVVGSASAAPTRNVTIQFRLKFTVQNSSSGSLAGTFRATGAISASGPVAENYILSPPRLRGQQPVETVAGVSTLNTSTGVVTIAYTGIVSSAAPDVTVTEGSWAISKTSGRFRGLRGRGRFSAVVNLTKRTMVKRYDGLVT